MKKIKKVLSTLGAFSAIFGVCCTIQSAGATPHDSVFFVGDSSSSECRAKVINGLVDDYSTGSTDTRDIKIEDDYDEDKVSLSLIDLPGQEKFRSLGLSIVNSCANTVVLVYNVNEEAQAQEECLKWWFDYIKEEGNSKISIILLASKCDKLTDPNEVDNRLEAMANNLGIEEKDRVIVSTENGYQIGKLGQMLARKALDRANRVQKNFEVKNLTDSQNKKSGCLLL